MKGRRAFIQAVGFVVVGGFPLCGIVDAVWAKDTPTNDLASSGISLSVWRAECPKGAVGLQAGVEDLKPSLNPAAKLRIVVLKDGKAAIAQYRGEPNEAPPSAYLEQGAGQYVLNFFKTAPGKKRFRGKDIECRTGSGTLVPPKRLKRTSFFRG